MTSFKRLFEGTILLTTPTTLFTSTVGVMETVIKQVSIVNFTTAAATIVVYLVPFGGTPGPSNVAIFNEAIGGNQSKVLRRIMNQSLQPGDYISASCSSVNSVAITASGSEVI